MNATARASLIAAAAIAAACWAVPALLVGAVPPDAAGLCKICCTCL